MYNEFISLLVLSAVNKRRKYEKINIMIFRDSQNEDNLTVLSLHKFVQSLITYKTFYVRISTNV